MRTFGLLLLVSGVIGFIYSGEQLDRLPPPAEGVSVSDSFRSPADKWELAKYGSAVAGLVGVLMAMFPKGR